MTRALARPISFLSLVSGDSSGEVGFELSEI
jgi:hypothetical protein